jgi:purine nucleoside permease
MLSPVIARIAGLLLALLTLGAGAADAQTAKISVRVVVVTTFELGADTGDTPGEFQNWVERLPLKESLPFPNGARALRYNPDKHVLGVVVGSGAINSSASIMALGLDPRFDLSKAYWIIAGIAGIDPDRGAVGSAAWAEWVVDRDLTHEIDAREIPADWSTGLVPLTRSRPFQAPPPPAGIFSPNAYHLNPALVDFAYHLTAGIKLDDTADLKGIRAGYAGHAAALEPPHVMKGDEISSSTWWVGWRMTTSAEDWMRYWTGGKGMAVTTAMEDHGVLNALNRLAQSGLARPDRALVLRTASNFSAPGAGDTAAGLLAAESSDNSATHLSAYIPALEAAYRVGSPVVLALADHWDRYVDTPP